jgi:hypothetical protein
MVSVMQLSNHAVLNQRQISVSKPHSEAMGVLVVSPQLRIRTSMSAKLLSTSSPIVKAKLPVLQISTVSLRHIAFATLPAMQDSHGSQTLSTMLGALALHTLVQRTQLTTQCF